MKAESESDPTADLEAESQEKVNDKNMDDSNNGHEEVTEDNNDRNEFLKKRT